MVKASHSHGIRCGDTGRAPAKSKDFGKQHCSLPRPLHLQNNTPTTTRLSEVGSIDTPIGGKQVNNQSGFGKPQRQTHTRHFRSRLDGCQQLTSRPARQRPCIFIRFKSNLQSFPVLSLPLSNFPTSTNKSGDAQKAHTRTACRAQGHYRIEVLSP